MLGKEAREALRKRVAAAVVEGIGPASCSSTMTRTCREPLRSGTITTGRSPAART